ncbi:MAG: hypothetical protein GY750_15845 [Lentisphaerae bacterium]|nr:hypothetical protein [Lentisphaerota bacterium]MCP4102871.1 hypothetical protein [Lentisphaerota bacterium]
MDKNVIITFSGIFRLLALLMLTKKKTAVSFDAHKKLPYKILQFHLALNFFQADKKYFHCLNFFDIMYLWL